ncbi:AMP-binding protein [Geodermatophilus sabuli]|uniref:Crotonobetaine/carnitine-CoA ligase n=1 Tax=Geodermatophilus sabuli TaxID=1564158 RepID=A0A285E6V9_9ACTN|nr:AMP-binding protein [Geodermatophilus sabuli]MBB3082528.1 crotonobetaine/carnitine-CoA ligase [Geodermatophilus sabuli]SNX94603.1 crotonobetaine/carnitine-CoA ligase [Geodermatophilus sabuli]
MSPETAQTAEAYPDMVAEIAAQSPDSICLEEVDGPVRTYGEVQANARAWRQALVGLGLAAGETVLTFVASSVASVELWCGIAYVGAIEASANPAYRGALLDHIISDTRARIAVVDHRYLSSVREALVQAPNIECVVVIGGDSELRTEGSTDVVRADAVLEAVGESADTWAGAAIPGHAPACILYTSGTTGLSKGVVVPFAQLKEAAFGVFPPTVLSQDDAIYLPFPPSHITYRANLMSAARVRGRAVLRERFSTDAFWADIEKHQCTATLLLGAMANFVYRQDAHPESTPLRRVQMIPVIPEVEDFKKRHDVLVTTQWGMTEVCAPIVAVDYDVSIWQSCGRLRDGFDARIVDEFDYEVEDGEVGELVLRPHAPWHFASGYWGNAEATADAWRNLWFHTGDQFRRDQHGNYYMVDRLKDSLRRRGENISSAEVEAAVLQHPDVMECAVVGVDSEWGEQEVMAFVVPKQSRRLDEAALDEFLSSRLAEFMRPRFIEVVDLLPKTPTEKIRKGALRERGRGANTWARPERVRSAVKRTSEGGAS